MGQFIYPDTYVNTGYTATVSHEENDGEETYVLKPKLITNEIMNLCFTYEKRTDEDGKSTKD